MRKGKRQTGQFSVLPGMAFIMQDLDQILPNGNQYNAGTHPWLITRVDDYYVEMAMCATLNADTEGKHRLSKLNYDDVFDIVNPCPPMDPNTDRISYVSMGTFKVFSEERIIHTFSLRFKP